MGLWRIYCFFQNDNENANHNKGVCNLRNKQPKQAQNLGHKKYKFLES